jgi:hypothetical protein
MAPQTEGQKVIQIVQEKPGGELLRNGETVAGSSSPSIFDLFFDRLQKEARRYQGQLDDEFEQFKESLGGSSQKLEDGLERALDDLYEHYSRLSEEIQRVPDSQELKLLKQSLVRLAEEMKRSQEAIREKIKYKVIPEIQKLLDQLVATLKKYNRQNEIEPLERQLNEMRVI